MLRNITETVVEQRLDSILSKVDYQGCTCTKCKEDIIAYALNNLPPKYVSTSTGELFARTQALSAQYDFAVLRVLAAAMKLVGESPRHEGQ